LDTLSGYFLDTQTESPQQTAGQDFLQVLITVVYSGDERVPVTLGVLGQTSCLFVCLFVWDRISLCSPGPGCPGTHSVDQAGLELRNPPASRVLELEVCTTMPSMSPYFLINLFFWDNFDVYNFCYFINNLTF
jgi:hypothetical protein